MYRLLLFLIICLPSLKTTAQEDRDTELTHEIAKLREKTTIERYKLISSRKTIILF